MEVDITKIVVAVIGLVAALISVFLIPYLRTKFTSEELLKADEIIKIAVGAAEQLFDKTDGAAKKQYVLDYLAGKGIKLDAPTIEIMIEAAVLELHAELYGETPADPVVTKSKKNRLNLTV